MPGSYPSRTAEAARQAKRTPHAWPVLRRKRSSSSGFLRSWSTRGRRPAPAPASPSHSTASPASQRGARRTTTRGAKQQQASSVSGEETSAATEQRGPGTGEFQRTRPRANLGFQMRPRARDRLYAARFACLWLFPSHARAPFASTRAPPETLTDGFSVRAPSLPPCSRPGTQDKTSAAPYTPLSRVTGLPPEDVADRRAQTVLRLASIFDADAPTAPSSDLADGAWPSSPVYGIWQPNAPRPTSLPPPPRSPSASLVRKRGPPGRNVSQSSIQAPPSILIAARPETASTAPRQDIPTRSSSVLGQSQPFPISAAPSSSSPRRSTRQISFPDDRSATRRSSLLGRARQTVAGQRHSIDVSPSSSLNSLRSTERPTVTSDPGPKVGQKEQQPQRHPGGQSREASRLSVLSVASLYRRAKAGQILNNSSSSPDMSALGASRPTSSNTRSRLPVAAAPSLSTAREDPPHASRLQILDHTHVANQSVQLGQMASQGEPSRGIARSLSQKSGTNAAIVSLDDADKIKTVRRSEGKRAGSEASASLRSRLRGDESDSGTSSRLSSIAQPGSNQRTSSFSSVRRIFRARSKSNTMPAKPPLTTDTIPEADEHGRIDTAPAPQRERKSSIFRRTKTPPRPKVDLEGVDVTQHRAAAAAEAPAPGPSLVRVQSQESQERKSGESGASQSTPATTPPTMEASLSDSRAGGAGIGSVRSQLDRSLTLQALGSVSPYSTRRSSGLTSPGLLPRLTGEGSREDNGIVTPTPARRGSTASTGAEAGTGFAYSTPQSTPSIPRASVPKIWQSSRNSRPLDDEDGEQAPAQQYQHGGRQFGSSTTSGSFSSYRTAKSSPRPLLASLDFGSSTPRPRQASRSPTRGSKSPLSDLIYNLEQRLSSQGRSDARDSSGEISAGAPALAAGPDTPSTTTGPRGLESDQVSLGSSSQSSHAKRRNTFGGSRQYSPDRWTSFSTASPLIKRAVGDMSMTEIEDSLAAVEAALQDHSMEGSFDPSCLRRKMMTPRQTSMVGTEGTVMAEEDDLNDFEMLVSPPETRITLPPDQEVAIADAIKQVRRAISSSQLPQIPNEDDSVSDLSPVATLHSTIESTPMRAARVRQESMQDVEEAYARMIELVGTAAGIDLNSFNSPMPSVRTWARRSNQSVGQTPATARPAGSGNLSYPSPDAGPTYVRDRTQSAAAVPSSARSSSSSRAARQKLLRESDALARAVALGRAPRETDEPVLRGRTSNVSTGSRRAASESPPRPRNEMASRTEAGNGRDRVGPGTKRVSIEKSANGSGGGTATGTSPSATIKTQGTPRSVDQDHMDTYSRTHSRSQSQQIHEWNRSHFSTSPSSTRPYGKHVSGGSNDSQNVDEQRRRSRGYVGGGGAGSGVGMGQGRRPGSNREWARLDEAMHRPQSGASNYSNALLAQTLRATQSALPAAASHGTGEDSRHQESVSSPPLTSLLALQRRHALERDSLLDMLERSRTEASSVRARNEELEADLHQEVTRVLELQRETDRMRENEEAMLDRIARLEEELKDEHANRIRIAELLERVQQAVDNAAHVEAADDPSGLARSPSASSTSLLQEDLHPASMRLLDSSLEEVRGGYGGVDRDHSIPGQYGTEDRSPSLRSYPSALGLAVDDQELSWSLDQEAPLEDTQLPSNSSHGSPPRTATATSAAKRFSFPAPSRLPLPSSPSTSMAGMSKSTSNTSTVVPRASLDGKRRFPTSSPVSGANGASLADRLGGTESSSIRRGLPRPSGSTTSTSPQSSRNLSISNSSDRGLHSIRSGIATASPQWRKVSTASRFTSTTGGDTSYTARTPDMNDVTTLDALSNESF